MRTERALVRMEHSPARFVLAARNGPLFTGRHGTEQRGAAACGSSGKPPATPLRATDRMTNGVSRDAVELADDSSATRSELDTAASRADRGRRRRLAALVRSPAAAEFTVRLTDEVSRLSIPARAARRFADLVAGADLSAFSHTSTDRCSGFGALVAPRVPWIVMPLVQRRLRAESAGVILSATDPEFAEHVMARANDGIRCNVNVLGEAIVGDEEARRRLRMVDERLRRPDVDYVSVKISASARRSACSRSTTRSPGWRNGCDRSFAPRHRSTRRSSSTSTWRSTPTSN